MIPRNPRRSASSKKMSVASRWIVEKIERAERAVAQQLVVERTRHAARMLGVLELALGRKRVAVQPLQQMPAVRADHLQLRRVQVRVDESGRDQLLREIDDLAFRRVGPITDAGDPALAGDGQMSVLEIAMR